MSFLKPFVALKLQTTIDKLKPNGKVLLFLVIKFLTTKLKHGKLYITDYFFKTLKNFVC
jgi:hypothetical protein